MIAPKTQPPVVEVDEERRRLEEVVEECRLAGISISFYPEYENPSDIQNLSATLNEIEDLGFTPSKMKREQSIPVQNFSFRRNFNMYHGLRDDELTGVYTVGRGSRVRHDRPLYAVVYDKEGIPVAGGFYSSVGAVKDVYGRYRSKIPDGFLRVCDFARAVTSSNFVIADFDMSEGEALKQIDNYFQRLGYRFEMGESPYMSKKGDVYLAPPDGKTREPVASMRRRKRDTPRAPYKHSERRETVPA